ncbi:hypothetical protein VB620_15000 [Nodularia harveyana UHCC-0300]|uniref:DUF1795 domain-containing protein n=1 Tax=Nodularia harveyana UHCC-0300 TaxID=2974287 RepID=A0ABU5UJM2_9CYAN|nr:hypothetical protein [Nodularia harveyana]MEA5582646.1 hypothetical protein [Nodularia harveyana UHCC-0300]
MTFKYLFPLLTATLISSGSPLLAAEKPQTPPETPVVQPKWQVYTAPDGGFTVLMPGQPEKDTQIQKTYMGEINLEMFVAEPPKQQVAYLVVYNDFPYSYGEITDPEVILNNARDMALKTTRSNLIRQGQVRTYSGIPGKEIEYVNTGGKITRNRMYVLNGRLYQVMAITSKKQQRTLAKTITGYLNSFNLVVKSN